MSDTNYAVPPGYYFQEWLVENEMSLGEAAHALPIEPDVFVDLLHGHTPLTADHAAALAELTDIPADSWLRYESQYRADTTRLAASVEDTDAVPALDDLAAAITNLAAERSRIDPRRLLLENALNIFVITRITTQQLEPAQRPPIERAADELAAAMRRCARELQP